MYENMRVKYLFINFGYHAYVKLQIALIIGWLTGSVLCYLFARGSESWYLKNSWWLCLIVGGLEVLESLSAISMAKKNYKASSDI